MKKLTYYVAPEFRRNPLSLIPSHIEITIGNRIYNNIHYRDAYLASISNNSKYFEEHTNSEWDSRNIDLYNDVAAQHPDFEEYDEDKQNYLMATHQYNISKKNLDNDLDDEDNELPLEIEDVNEFQKIPVNQKILVWHCDEEKKKMPHIYKK